MHQPLTILYDDDDLVAVHKPAGLLVHRSSIDSRAERFLLQTLRDQIGAAVHPVHRLDKATSGIVVFARHAQAASRLAQAFRDGAVTKTYVAVVRGWAPEAVDIDHPLRDIADQRSRRQTFDSREAFTAVRCLARAELAAAVGRYPTARYSLVTCHPRTGRRHQIRRHLKHLRHPIIGDVNYGDGAHNRFFRDALGITRLLLAASLLRVPHPRTDQAIELHAPLDASFLDALAWPEWQGVATDEA
jgi:tRNA pseudouridine65 synthase